MKRIGQTLKTGKPATVLIAAGLLLLCSNAALAQYDSLYLKNAAYKQQRALHSVYRSARADVVMLGNSITFGAQWNELLNRPGIVNRGIGGDNTYGMLHRLDDVIRLHPRVCCVMAGINDLFADIPLDTVVANYCRILDELRSNGVVPVVQSTLFVSPRWKRSGEKNPLVSILNDRLLEETKVRKILFVDVNVALSADGVLREENTTDGVHLTAAAYKKWAEMLDKALTKLGIAVQDAQ